MTKSRTPTIFANHLNLRLFGSELVMEFGTYFPEPGEKINPVDLKPDIRVVLPAGALGGLQHLLNQAIEQRKQQQNAARAKQTPGFKPPATEGSQS